MSDVKWIKIVTDIFDDEKIKYIETMPSGDTTIVIWFRLLCLAGKSNRAGVLMMTDRIAYTDEMLASIFNRDIKIIQLALSIFESLGMIEVMDNRIYLSNWEKHQNLDKMEKIRIQTRDRVSKHRQNRIPCNDVTQNVTQDVTHSNATDLDLDLDKELEKEKENTLNNIVEKAMEYLNIQTGHKFKANAANTKHLIARIRDGYTLKDVMTVIHNKTVDWESNPEMVKYLRPDTLFGSKFDTYLQFTQGMSTNAEVDEMIKSGTDHLRNMTGPWDCSESKTVKDGEDDETG
ncbi:MAG: phage replisome organizer N-terminal domain-containing protein [Erysipelotrichaceae bacterium]